VDKGKGIVWGGGVLHSLSRSLLLRETLLYDIIVE